MKPYLLNILFVVSLIWFTGCKSNSVKTTIKPNIVFIMSDDVGIGDISCYGAKMIHTPNIDKLAEQGIKFNNYHTCGALCSPTRYSTVTGRYPVRTKEVGTGSSSPWDYLFIETDRITIGSLAQKMGYKTAAIGKWHLGYGAEKHIDWSGVLRPGPNDIGFDYHWGVPTNHNDRYRCFIENDRIYGLDPNVKYEPATSTERVKGLLYERVDDQVDSMLTVKATNFIRQNKDHPFLLYMTPCAAHTHVTPGVQFRGKSKAGQYGDYVQELDFHVGQIMDLIDELGLIDNTIFVFTSDNGGQLHDVKNAGRGLNLANESFDVRAKARTAKTDALNLGHKTNLDLRGHKGTPYEGGFRVPFIIRWPDKFEGGSESARLITSADLLATLADLFNVELPENAGDDSFSYLDELTGKKVNEPRQNAVLLSGAAYSFIEGDWKLIDFSYSVRHPQEKFELYNIREDPGELKDLSVTNPETLNLMRQKLKQIINNGRSRKK